jgi:glutamyl-tRNA synthetase
MRERMRTLNSFIEEGDYFFRDPATYEEKAVQKYWMKEGAVGLLEKCLNRLNSLSAWHEESIEQTIRQLAEQEDVGAGKLIHPIRLAITGKGSSPGLFELMAILGKMRVIRRIEKALHVLKNI